MNEKLKSFILNDQLFYGTVVILVGVTSFGLGQSSATSVISNAKENKVLIMPEVMRADIISPEVVQTAPKSASQLAAVISLVASRSGTKYHLLTCPGAKQIKEENKIYFASVLEAEAAGYKPAANCPELTTTRTAP